MSIGLDAQGIYTIGQAEYTTVRDQWATTGNPGSMAQFLWEMLTQGGRAIAGANDSGYSSYPQIVADLAAHGINVNEWGLPTVQQINAKPADYPGVNPVGNPIPPSQLPAPPPAASPPPVDGTPPPAPTPVATDPNQLTAFKAVKKFLDEIGFGDMATLGPDGQPGGWLWDQVVKKGYTTESEITSALDGNDRWVERFQAHYDQLSQVGTGAPVQVLSFAEVRQYEKDAADLMRSYNMPPQLYDNYHDFQQLMKDGVSMQSLNHAITVSWNRVQSAGGQVRQAFTDLYGPMGDSMMASFFLDNAKYEQKLDMMSRAASLKGTAVGIGFDIGKPLAETLAGMGLEGETARQGLSDVAAQRQLFDERISEGKDLTTETGVESRFGVSESSAKSVHDRAAERAAALAGGGGGILSQQGVLSGRTAT